jgi:hypothetical protein
MKLLKCVPCAKTQKDGKFCLDCGKQLTEVVTPQLKKFQPIKPKRQAEQLKRDIRAWLHRIGVQNPDIQIDTSDGAGVTYRLNGKTYRFKSVMQPSPTANLTAVEMFLHNRVLGIERGIETTEEAFKAYEALPDPAAHLRSMSDDELRAELKRHHPDTGTGDQYQWKKLMDEKERRRL